MNKLIKFTILFLIVFTSLITAQVKENIKKVDEKASAEKINSTQATDDQILFKNETGNSILTITDEGDNAGSIFLPSLSSIGSSSGKLYNLGGSLYWNGSALGTSVSAGGWTKDGTNVYLSNLTDYVGIGTSTPGNHLEIRTPSVSSAARFNLGNLDDSHHLFLYSGKDGNPNPLIGWQDGDSLRLTKFDGSTTTELIRIASNGNVGIGTTTPQSILSVGGEGNNSCTIWGNSNKTSGITIFGISSGYGGISVEGSASGESGIGVVGHSGSNGYGVAGYSLNSKALYGEVSGLGTGVYGIASADGGKTYGGYFETKSYEGTAVYGLASDNDEVGVSYGGYFETLNAYGIGVYGKAVGSNYVGSNKGGLFEADGGDGSIGVYGYASNNDLITNYGGYFEANGTLAEGVYGVSKYIGVSGLSNGDGGIGIYGVAHEINSIGVMGDGQAYDFYANGPGTDYGSASSIRWKKNITKIDEPLEKISNIRGVYFDWDEEHGGEHDVGMIAEEVGKVLPEIVVYEENGIDAKGMDYSRLTPLLVEVAKAQQKIIEELTKRIEALEKQK